MLNLRFTAGVGVGISGACGPPLVWRARKPLPSALRSSAALALGLARQRAPVPEHRLLVVHSPRLCRVAVFVIQTNVSLVRVLSIRFLVTRRLWASSGQDARTNPRARMHAQVLWIPQPLP